MDLFKKFTNWVFAATVLFVVLVAIAIVGGILKW